MKPMISPALAVFIVFSFSESAISNDAIQASPSSELTREVCRAHRNDIELMAQCIAIGVYDPCDDIGSQATIARCYASHLFIVDRRIETAEESIRNEKLGQLHSLYATIDIALSTSRKKWEITTEKYCQGRDRVSQAVENRYGIRSSYPDGVDSGQEYNDCVLQAKKEWARELESFVAEFASKMDNFNKLDAAARLRGFLLGEYPLFQRQRRKCK